MIAVGLVFVQKAFKDESYKEHGVRFRIKKLNDIDKSSFISRLTVKGKLLIAGLFIMTMGGVILS